MKGEPLPRREFYSCVTYNRLAMARLLWRMAKNQIQQWEIDRPLISVVQQGLTEVLQFLIEIGAKVDSCDEMTKTTPLMFAAQLGRVELLPILLKAGAEINRQDVSMVSSIVGGNEGETALMKACAQGHSEVVRLLIEAGADVNIIGEGGKTALDFSGTTAKHAAVRELLLKAGAKSGKELRAVAQSAKTKPSPKKPSAPIVVQSMDDARCLLEERCGASAKPHPEIKRAFFFHLKQDASGNPKAGKPFIRKLESLRAELVPLVAPAGLLVVRTHHLKLGLGLCLLPAKHKFDAVQQFGFSGRKWGISPAKALTFLKKLDKLEPFELVECSRDALGGKFAAGTKQGAKLAKELEAFCPFVCEEHDDDPKVLAKHLAKGGEFVLWWD